MAIEIERKYLVRDNIISSYLPQNYIQIKQGFLNTDLDRLVRVRTKNKNGYLTIKGKKEGIKRMEFEYKIPHLDAENLLLMCSNHIISKKRYEIKHQGFLWEIDIFEGSNQGLILAEIELDTEDKFFELPQWIDIEVSDDERYYNAYLSQHPYQTWDK